MADENTADLVVNVETEKAINDLEKFEKSATGSTFNVEKAFGALKTAAGAAVAFFAAKQVVDFFAGGVEAAVAQEEAVAKLGQQLQLTGDYSAEAVDHFAAFADEMERTSKFGDDVVLSQVAVAKSFGVSNEQAEKLVRGAIELSSITGENLQASVKKLGGTLSGVAGELEKQVPALRGLTKEALQTGAALDIVVDRFGGSAAAEIATFSGASIQANNAFGNFAESFGKVIVENEALVSGIQAVTTIFGSLQAIVEENEDALTAFVTFGVQATATGLSVSLEVVGFFIRGFEGLVNVTNLATAGFLELASFFTSTWRNSVGSAYELLLEFAEGIVGVLENVPGVSTALGAAGFEADAASSSIHGLREGLTEMLDGGVKSVEGARDGMYEFAASTAETFDSFNSGFESFQASVDGALGKVFEADGKVAESGKKAMSARQSATKAAIVDEKELAKLAEEAKKFGADLAKETVDEVAKVSIAYREQLDKIEEFESKSVISKQESARLRELAERNLVDKIAVIRDKENEAAIAATQKAADEQRAIVEKAATSPLSFLVTKVDVDRSAVEGFQNEIGLAVGSLGKILDGAAGAKSLISEGAGAFADAFVPGIGGAVGGIVSKLAEGPDATKAFIKEFVASVPDIVTAIAESAPVVVEALVDSLINEGGIVKIAVALARAMAGEAVLKNIGKQLGIDFGSAFNSANVAQTLGNGISQGAAVIPVKIGEGFNIAGDAIQNAGFQFVERIRSFFSDAFSFYIDTAFTKPIDYFKEQVDKLLHFEFPSIEMPEIPTPEWLDPFIDAINNLLGFQFPGLGGGGGGGGGFIGQVGSALGFAEGGIIPEGYPNDTFFMRATSGERILRPDDSETLSAMLNEFESGGGLGNAEILAVLYAILAELQAGKTVAADLKFNNDVLAKIILKLNKQNARLAA